MATTIEYLLHRLFANMVRGELVLQYEVSARLLDQHFSESGIELYVLLFSEFVRSRSHHVFRVFWYC